MGVSNRELNQLSLSLNSLGLNGKLTGGGWGGCVIHFLTKNEYKFQKLKIEQILKNLQKNYEIYEF